MTTHRLWIAFFSFVLRQLTAFVGRKAEMTPQKKEKSWKQNWLKSGKIVPLQLQAVDSRFQPPNGAFHAPYLTKQAARAPSGGAGVPGTPYITIDCGKRFC